MGVYIKGMEMPTSCMLCPFCVEEADPANGEMCMVTGTLMPPCTRERLDNCPLIPVPEHGDLIDKDALDIYRREEQAWTDYERNPDNEYLEGVKDGLHEAAKQLSIAPTIIPAEEGE